MECTMSLIHATQMASEHSVQAGLQNNRAPMHRRRLNTNGVDLEEAKETAEDGPPSAAAAKHCA